LLNVCSKFEESAEPIGKTIARINARTSEFYYEFKWLKTRDPHVSTNTAYVNFLSDTNQLYH